MASYKYALLHSLVCFGLFNDLDSERVYRLNDVSIVTKEAVMEQVIPMFKDHRLSIIPRHIINNSPENVFLDHPTKPTSAAVKYSSIYWLSGEYSQKIYDEVTKQIGPHTTYILNDKWENTLKNLQNHNSFKITSIERSEFSSQNIDVKTLDFYISKLPKELELKRIDRRIAKELYDIDVFESAGHIHPYGSADRFVTEGIGYVITKDGKYVAAATSVATAKGSRPGIEIQVDVAFGYRHMGYAKIVSAALIKECLRLGIEPHWDAANHESAKVALALGYEITETYFVYKIEKSKGE